MPEEIKGGLRPKEILWGIISLIIFIIIFTLVFRMYKSEGVKSVAEYSEVPKTNDYLEIYFEVVGVDPIKGDLVTRGAFIPHGKFLNAKEFLSDNVNFYINASAGKQEYNFQKGKIMNPMEATFGLYGMVMNYPQDEHESQIIMMAEIPLKTSDKQNPDVHKEGDVVENVPIAITFEGDFHGYEFNVQKDTTFNAPYYAISVKITRAGSTKFFSYFIMAVMWLLAGIVVFVILSVVIRGRKIELTKFAFMSALIFALPALRNMQPLTPTIGTFSDYVSFFWAEALVALSLFTVVFTWLRRPPDNS